MRLLLFGVLVLFHELRLLLGRREDTFEESCDAMSHIALERKIGFDEFVVSASLVLFLW